MMTTETNKIILWSYRTLTSFINNKYFPLFTRMNDIKNWNYPRQSLLVSTFDAILECHFVPVAQAFFGATSDAQKLMWKYCVSGLFFCQPISGVVVCHVTRCYNVHSFAHTRCSVHFVYVQCTCLHFLCRHQWLWTIPQLNLHLNALAERCAYMNCHAIY